MSSKRPSQPYLNLGERLKELRVSKHESIADVSGAVEISETELVRIESGHDRPSQDILLLLFSHFSLESRSAAELWSMAGYDGTPKNAEAPDLPPDMGPDQADIRQQMMMVMIDPRIMYSDGVEAVAGDRGVVLNFSQIHGMNDQPLTVSRIGMSREQAKQLMGVLHQVLYDLDNPRPRSLGDGSPR